MGNVRLGIDLEKTLALRDQYDVHAFIETGTFKMGTTLLVQPYFDRIITIEAYEPRWRKNLETLSSKRPPNVDFWFGDSRTWLSEALDEIDAPCLLWLDAHWNGNADLSRINGDECPLREELQAVVESKFGQQHVIMIDDARLFTSPPTRPHDPAQWMTYEEIQSALRPRTCYIQEDVIYAEPVARSEG